MKRVREFVAPDPKDQDATGMDDIVDKWLDEEMEGKAEIVDVIYHVEILARADATGNPQIIPMRFALVTYEISKEDYQAYLQKKLDERMKKFQK